MYMYYIYHKQLLIMHQSIPAVPTPRPPTLMWGICLPCQSQGWEWLTALYCSSHAVPWGSSAKWRGRTSCMGNSLSSISYCTGLHPSIHQPTAYNLSFPSALTQHRKQELPVISHCSIGVHQDDRGCFRWSKRFSNLTGQLSPTFSWGAPSQ